MAEQIGYSSTEIAVGNGIVLKPLKVTDSREMFALIQSDPEHFSQFGDETATSNQVLEDMIARNLDQRPDQIRFTIQDNAKIVGYIEATQRPEASWEIGGWLGKQYTGKYYMTKVVVALTQHIFDNSQAARIFAITHNDHEKSKALLIRAGYQPGGQYPDIDHVLFFFNRPK
jgi:RimJ/RimL family protein N-acetyltransferase